MYYIYIYIYVCVYRHVDTCMRYITFVQCETKRSIAQLECPRLVTLPSILQRQLFDRGIPLQPDGHDPVRPTASFRHVAQMRRLLYTACRVQWLECRLTKYYIDGKKGPTKSLSVVNTGQTHMTYRMNLGW
jgi:hypothetical protein